jgi:hypothetical protein
MYVIYMCVCVDAQVANGQAPQYAPRLEELREWRAELIPMLEAAVKGAENPPEGKMSRPPRFLRYLLRKVKKMKLIPFRRFMDLYAMPGMMLSGLNKLGALVDEYDLEKGEDYDWLSDERWRVNPTLIDPRALNPAKNDLFFHAPGTVNVTCDGGSVILHFMQKHLAATDGPVPWNSIIEGADEDNWRMAAWHIFLPIAKALRQRVEDHTVSFTFAPTWVRLIGDGHTRGTS